jgi:hypothetical protein
MDCLGSAAVDQYKYTEGWCARYYGGVVVDQVRSFVPKRALEAYGLGGTVGCQCAALLWLACQLCRLRLFLYFALRSTSPSGGQHLTHGTTLPKEEHAKPSRPLHLL